MLKVGYIVVNLSHTDGWPSESGHGQGLYSHTAFASGFHAYRVNIFFLLEFALGRWYCSVLMMMCKWSEWVSEWVSTQFATQPALLCKSLYRLQGGYLQISHFQLCFRESSCNYISSPLIFQSRKQKVQKLHVVWKWVCTGNVVFFCSPFCTNFRYEHICTFFLCMCFFLNDCIFTVQNIPQLSYMMYFCGLKNNLYSV